MGLAETAQLAVDLNLRGNFRSGMKGAQRDLRGFTKQTQGVKAKLAGLRGEAKKSILTGVGMGGGLAVFGLATTAVSGVINVMGDAVNAASDLAESQSKVDMVYRVSAKTIHDWAEDLDSAYGLTEQAALEAAGTFGNFIQALGTSEEEANSMSRTLVELSGDLASFNNIASDDIVLALRSGLAGETEPMRRLGVDISAAAVEAKVLALGLATTKGAITQTMKVAARYAIIMDKTASAQGDAVRTGDEYAGQQRKLSAEMGNAMADLGEVLLPVMTDLTKLAVKTLPKVVQGFKDVAESAEKFVGPLEDVKSEIDKIVDAIPPELRDVWDGWAGGLGPVPNTIGMVIDAVNGSTDAFYSMETELVRATNAMATLPDTTKPATDAIGGIGEAAKTSSKLLDRMARSLDHVATTSRSDIKSDAKSTQQAIREAARSKSWSALGSERDRLRAQRAGYRKSGDFDVLAIIDKRLEDIDNQIRARRQVSRGYREQGRRGKERRQARNRRPKGKNTVDLEDGDWMGGPAPDFVQLASDVATNTSEQFTETKAHIADMAVAFGFTMTHTETMAANIANWPTSIGGRIDGIASAVRSIPAPVVTVNNNISATTVQTSITKVVSTNRTRGNVIL